jgi:hypothetical protein
MNSESLGIETRDARRRARRPLRLAAFSATVLLGMIGIELINTARIWKTHTGARQFPQDHVSQGIWSMAAWVRAPKSQSTDAAPTLRAASLASGGRGELYSEFRSVGSSYIYPPTAAVALLPFGWIMALGGEPLATQWMDLLGRACVAATIGVAAAYLSGLMRSRTDWVLGVLLLLAFYPLRWSLACVQVQSLVTLLLVAAIISYARLRRLICGILLGLAACLKPHLALLVFFAVWRREYRVAGGALATGLVFVLGSIALMSWSPWNTYFTEVLPTLSAGYAFTPNQSINGIVLRWRGQPPEFVIAPVSIIVSCVTWGATAVFALLAVWPRISTQDGPASTASNSADRLLSIPSLLRATDLGIASLAVSLASPIVWEHHYGPAVLLFVITLNLGAKADLRPGFFALVGCAYLLVATYWLPLRVRTSGPLTLLDSPQFFGAVLLLGAAWYAQRRLQAWPGATGADAKHTGSAV